MRTTSKVQEKMKAQARTFFAGEAADADAEEIRQRVAAKLLSYPAPLKPMPGGKPEPTVVPGYKTIPLLRKKSSGFRRLVENLAEINVNLALLEQQKATLRGEIQLLVELSGEKSVMMDHWMVTKLEGRKGNAKIEGKRLGKELMKRGYSADDVAIIIEKATVRGKPVAPSVTVRDTTKVRKGGGAAPGPWGVEGIDENG